MLKHNNNKKGCQSTLFILPVVRDPFLLKSISLRRARGGLLFLGSGVDGAVDGSVGAWGVVSGRSPPGISGGWTSWVGRSPVLEVVVGGATVVFLLCLSGYFVTRSSWMV